MKKIITNIVVVLSLITLIGCNKKEEGYAKLDYSKLENWYACECNGSKSVDTLYIYPTCVMKGEKVTTIDENRKYVKSDRILEVQASVYAESSNIYMPLYRQMAMSTVDDYTSLEFCKELASLQGYADLVNFLDYYFEHFNNNKPFILAGHSQGSAQIYNILTMYMQDHPTYLDRMIACYGIGFNFSKKEIAKYPNLKFATGESDTNCIITYNTFGPTHLGYSILHDSDSFVINPINWKTDETYASDTESKGSYIGGEKVAGVSDAQIDLEYGYLVSTADPKYELTDVVSLFLFGTHSFHTFDYGFYHANLTENVAKRVEAFVNAK